MTRVLSALACVWFACVAFVFAGILAAGCDLDVALVSLSGAIACVVVAALFWSSAR